MKVKCNFYNKADKEQLQELTTNKILCECTKRKINLLRRNTKTRIWTMEEYNFMVDNWGKLSKQEIAEKLNRTLTAVNCKANRIGLKQYFVYSDLFSLNDLYRIIYHCSIDTYTPDIWNKYNFPIRNIATNKNPIRAVNISEFFEWFEKHKRLIDLSKTEEGCFHIDEPDWLKEKRIADKRAIPYQKHNIPWSEEEEDTLIRMIDARQYGYRDISVAIKRTEGAIKRRIRDLKLTKKPIKAYNHNKWSESEIEKVKDLWLKGYQSCVIAEEINRSALAINGILERHNYFGDKPLKGGHNA